MEYPVQGEPLVSILIPNRDQRETLKNCIRSIREKSTYRNYEILIIENNSREAETFLITGSWNRKRGSGS